MTPSEFADWAAWAASVLVLGVIMGSLASLLRRGTE